jgi:UDP-N-acetylmuramate dehydrogenase
VSLVGELTEAHAVGDVLIGGGGAKIAVLLTRAAKHRWAGLEMLAGVPGTLGGAVRMNAGTALGEIADRLIDVDVALPDGSIVTLPKDALELSYRHSTLPPGGVVARVRLQVGGDWAESEARMRHHLERRKATQPLDLPSCGSTFKNPPGDAAGRLIEACGLKGYTVGGAQVSPKHANFVVNLGGATASDIDAVIRHAQAEVLRQFGVALEREVQYAGVWT